ncbi:hypothetical protein ATANTOWER_023114 [Ataeniobius toweri]|uniref:Uncharacterized protein n=1 Tax=Ataeniobius toweri TaxID=208326 RepID=A0ABU7BR56_9TELE|nr:hypothetical protein [Ataeniobius toweri]
MPSLAHLSLGSLAHSSLQNISSSIRLDERGLCTAIFRSFQVFHQIQAWTVAWPLQNIHRVVLKPLLSDLGCGFVVLLKNKLLSQFKVKNALEQVFIQDGSVHCCIHLSFYPD